jgi:DNA polymerase-4
MAVAGDPSHRHGIILAKNELAKARGVKTAETIWQAWQKCPELVLVPPRHDKYYEYSLMVNAIYGQYTDLVEPFGIDESWLDVTNVGHLFGSGEEIADTLRKRIRTELDLTISVGVSFNKVFAKLGSDYKKPDATTVITEENYRDIVFPLPVETLLYVGRSARQALNTLGIQTIGGLAKADRGLIARRLGKIGEQIHDYANGLDHSPVTSAADGQGMKSVGNGMTFRHDLAGWEEIASAVAFLADEVAYRMRRYGVKCRTISVTIRAPDFNSISRQRTLGTPTNLTMEVRDVALQIIKQVWNAKKLIRMLTITGSGLVGEQTAEQLSLFGGENARGKLERAESAVYQLRERFGRDAVKLGMAKQP